MLKKIPAFYTALLIIFTTSFSEAKTIKVLPPPQTSLVVDIKTGKVLHTDKSNTRVHPASLAKLMTLYILFEEIESGKLRMNQKLLISENAAKMPPCKLGVAAGESITAREAILALIVRSANDVAVAAAENIKGSEKNFVKLMNNRAKQLGMKDTNFENSSGWHHPTQKTTARDLAKLAMAIRRDFPQYYPLFSQTSFTFKKRVIQGHNHVTANYKGAEGLKTGYTNPSGFNLITTASRNNVALLAIVTGSKTAAARNQKITQLLDKHFDNLSVKNSQIKAITTKSQPKKPVKMILAAKPKISKKKVARSA